MIELEVVGSLPVAKQNVRRALEESGLWMLQSIQRNFELGGRPVKWTETQARGGRALIDSGALYESGEFKVQGNEMTVTWGRGLPYASIQNFGGEVHPLITIKSKRFFWAMFYETGDEKWKWMALKSVGETLDITIPARPFMMFQDSDIEHITSLFANYAIEFEGTSESVGVSYSGSSDVL